MVVNGKAFIMKSEEERKICRICLKLLALDFFIELTNVEDVITKCAPELDIHAVNRPVICQACLERLKDNFEFFTNCLEVEEKLVLYSANSRTKIQVNLFDVLRFSSETKPGQDFVENTPITITHQVFIKKEALDKEELYENYSCRDDNVKYQLKTQDDTWVKIKTEKDGHQTHGAIHKSPDGTAVFKCAMCSFKTKHKYNLTRHKLVHQKREETEHFQCDKCTHKTKRKNDIKRHDWLVHKTPISFNCYICTYTTEYKSDMEEHKLMHAKKGDKKLVTCDKCTYKTRYQSVLNNHKLSHRKPEEIVFFKCNECVYKTRRKYNLKKHLMWHTMPEAVVFFYCDKCNYKSTYKATLIRHKLIHKNTEETEPFICDKSVPSKKDK